MAPSSSFTHAWLPGPSTTGAPLEPASLPQRSIPSESFTSDTPPGSTASTPQPSEKKLSGWKHSMAGSIGGMTGAIVTSPFDVMKVSYALAVQVDESRLTLQTRLQSDLFKEGPAVSSRKGKEPLRGAAVQRTGIRGAMYQFVDTGVLIKRIATNEGWQALFRGLGPALVGIIPARAINFYFYPTSKAYLAKQFPNAPTTSSGHTAEDSPVVHLGAAVIAGIMTATGTNPIWVVKTRLQLSARQKHISPTFYTATAASSPLPKPIAASAAALASTSTAGSAVPATPRAVNALGTAADIIRTEGFRGLYRGLSASYLGVSEGVIQWVLYERFKKLGKPTSATDDKPSVLSFVTSIVGASGGAKAVASLITYPHEVIRTRLRQPAVNGVKRYHGLYQTLMLVAREEGAAALYGGLTAHMLRVVPNAACMFLIYEVVADRLGR